MKKDMRLELGKSYELLRTEGEVEKFKFIGNIENRSGVFVLFQGIEIIELSVFLTGGYHAYWEVNS